MSFETDPQKALETYLWRIRLAEKSILVVTWIVTQDEIALEILGACAARAACGVDVKIICFGGLMPDLASKLAGTVDVITKPVVDWEPWRAKGIQVLPQSNFVVTGVHQKILVTDHTEIIFSDRNLSSEYYGIMPTFTGVDLYMSGGELANKVTKLLLEQKTDPISCDDVQFYVSDAATRVDRISPALIRAFDDAKQSIVVVNVMFDPSDEIKSALERASKRGVRVSILCNFYDNVNANVRATFSKRVARFHADNVQAELLGYAKHGITMHSKFFVIDTNEIYFGSFNLDFFSQEILNDEYMVYFRSNNGEFLKIFDELKQHSVAIDSSVLDAPSACFACLCPCIL